MRILAPAAALVALTLAAPAAAETPAQRARVDPAQAAMLLQNPLVQDGVAQALTQLAGIVLDTRVGALAVVNPDGAVRPGDTLGDLARRDDPAFDRHLHDRARSAVTIAGAMAGQAVEVRRTADRLAAALAPLEAYLSGTSARP